MAPERYAPYRLAPERFAPDRSAAERSARWRSAPDRLALDREAYRRSQRGHSFSAKSLSKLVRLKANDSVERKSSSIRLRRTIRTALLALMAFLSERVLSESRA